MNNINPIYSTNNLYLPAFKQKEVNNGIATNPINSNISMRGMDALASYNFALINKNKDFDIPTIKMIPIPNDISKIDGEKIYSPDGSLDCVVQDNGKYKIVYQNDSFKTIKVIDKISNKVIKEQGCYVANTKEVRVCENTNNDAIGYFTDYDEINGEMVPVGKGKHIYYADDTKKEFIQLLNTNQYQMIERSNVSKDAYSCDRVIDYDSHGNIKKVTEYNQNSEIIKETNY